MMDRMLQLISPNELKAIDSAEIDRAIAEIIEASKDNKQEITELTLESVSLLTSASARAGSLQSQGGLKRMWNSLTGKNEKLRNAISQDTASAQYAAQQTINCVLKECEYNRQLMVHIREGINAVLLDVQNGQNILTNDVKCIRETIVAMFRDYNRKIDQLDKRNNDMEASLGARCENCRKRLRTEQIVCPGCGEIQILKAGKLPMDIQEKLNHLSSVMSKTHWDTQASWAAAAQRCERAMLQVSEIVEGQNLHLKSSLVNDIRGLIAKCRSTEFQIAIVGVLKAGKSMLMNALIGADLASTGLNSETAALTKFRSSSENHYMEVKFYSPEKWRELLASAQKSGAGDAGNASLWARLNAPQAIEGSKKWIGHEPIRESFTTLDELKEQIQHWTSARSEEHLFAEEVVVGIKREFFQMPDEVVFVDTPGLHDPVQYRSKITEEYIGRANAVLVAVRPTGLTDENFGTITKVLDYAGGNKRKVYIIGTQSDILTGINDYDTLINGPDGWVERLVQAKRYKSPREAGSQILTTSAYLQLCMNKAIKLTQEQLGDPQYFSDDEYRSLQTGVARALNKRSYAVENLSSSPEDQNAAAKVFGIKNLKARLESDLINKYRELIIQDIGEDYRHCKQELLAFSKDAVQSKDRILATARQGADELRKKLEQVEVQKEELNKETEDIREALSSLRDFTDCYINKMNAKATKGRS